MNIKEQMDRYSKLEKEIEGLNKDAERKKMEKEYAQNDLEERFEKAKEYGIEFDSLNELKEIYEKEAKDFEQVLDSTERKLNEVEK